MRVTLVNPPSPGSSHISRGLMGGFGMAVGKSLLYPPIELAHVASVLRAARHKVHIFDCDADELTTDDLLARLRVEKPKVIGVDTSTASWTSDLALAGALAEQIDAHIFDSFQRLDGFDDRADTVSAGHAVHCVGDGPGRELRSGRG